MAHQPRALLIDRDSRSAKRIQHELHDVGLIVSLAESGPQIIRTLSFERLDLVLVDYEWPIHRVCEIIATNGPPRVPIVAIASQSIGFDMEQLRLCYPLTAVIWKPFTLGKLARVIRRWCRLTAPAADSDDGQ